MIGHKQSLLNLLFVLKTMPYVALVYSAMLRWIADVISKTGLSNQIAWENTDDVCTDAADGVKTQLIKLDESTMCQLFGNTVERVEYIAEWLWVAVAYMFAREK